ncbi:hypothetical protein HPB50_003604 [Hyalomma asiaticum]|uniref:Uncharacterized protein n=1 Tax=Hyalomma asiaticum TaxID=266040 RepID=A0ACB7T3R2_HYAAI|nr:hypothetical protein HPB50_003604 [Hyalomma asiaticum]
MKKDNGEFSELKTTATSFRAANGCLDFDFNIGFGSGRNSGSELEVGNCRLAVSTSPDANVSSDPFSHSKAQGAPCRSAERNGLRSELFRTSKVGWFLRKPIWRNIKLQPFEKKLYEEHTATASRSMAEVAAYRRANGVSVKGNNVAKPILALQESNFPDFVVKSIEASRGYASPTRIEAHCWPIALSCRNILGTAETGSHKALAYVLPAVIHASRQPPLQQQEGPIAVLVAPTRELAQQIHTVASELGEHCGMRSVCAANGIRKQCQCDELKESCHILVATPRRLIEFIEEGTVNLHRCTYLVLDEVDRMVTMGCEKHVLKIVELCRPDRQMIIWVTSWKKGLRPLVEDFLEDYVEINFAKAPEKADRAVVFANTKLKADEIAWKVRQRGWPAIGLHGKKRREERDWILSMFRGGAGKVLVTTDVIAQEMTLENVRLVVNYDCPDCTEVYVHRARHVKRPGESGVVHTFIVPTQQQQARTLIEVLEDGKQAVSPELRNITKNVRSVR